MKDDAPFYERTELEKDIEKEGSEYAFKRGWFETKLTSLSRNGWPDRFYARAGIILLVEWKRPGKEPTRQQLILHRELREHGVQVHVLDNLDDAFTLFR